MSPLLLRRLPRPLRQRRPTRTPPSRLRLRLPLHRRRRPYRRQPKHRIEKALRSDPQGLCF